MILQRRLNAPGHELVLYNAKRGFVIVYHCVREAWRPRANAIAWLESSGFFRGIVHSSSFDSRTPLASEFLGLTRIYSSPAVRVGIEELPAPVVRAPFFLAASSCFSCSMFLT